MKILSKRAYDELTVGDGPNLLRVTDDQLDLIVSILCNMVLDRKKQYGSAALDLICAIEDAYGTEVINDVSENVKFKVCIMNDDNDVLYEMDGEDEAEFFSLEVIED
jgi:hypothetical protein